MENKCKFSNICFCFYRVIEEMKIVNKWNEKMNNVENHLECNTICINKYIDMDLIALCSLYSGILVILSILYSIEWTSNPLAPHV